MNGKIDLSRTWPVLDAKSFDELRRAKNRLSEDEGGGFTLREQIRWYDEWKRTPGLQDKIAMLEGDAVKAALPGLNGKAAGLDGEALFKIFENSFKEKVMDLLGEDGRKGARYVGRGASKCAIVYDNGSCLKLQYSNELGDQVRSELAATKKLMQRGKVNVVAKIYSCARGSILCEACGSLDDARFSQITGQDKSRVFAIMTTLAQLAADMSRTAKAPSDIIYGRTVEDIDEWTNRLQRHPQLGEWGKFWQTSREECAGIFRKLQDRNDPFWKGLTDVIDAVAFLHLDDWRTEGNVGTADRDGKLVPVLVDLGL